MIQLIQCSCANTIWHFVSSIKLINGFVKWKWIGDFDVMLWVLQKCYEI